MRYLEYYDGARVRRLPLQGAFEATQRQPRASRRGAFVGTPAFAAMRPQATGGAVVQSVKDQRERLGSRFRALSEAHTLVMPAQAGEATVVPTETVAIDAARKSDIDYMKKTFDMEVIEEGSHGKVLMRVPDGADDGIAHAARAALALSKREGPALAHPNFLRLVQHPPLPAASPGAQQWALDNRGNPGLIGADVHALAAWTVTRGDAAVRVAILDEGVDTAHPFLAPALVAEADFVDSNPTAVPDGDDAHGTACAGIVVSRNADVSGLAPGASLVAARIAKSDALGFWVFDDFATADAIDWCWDTAAAAVLSNSWGGGPPAPVITRAFERAMADGRGGRGAVVIAAAGNSQQPSVDYPASIPDVVAVGASNQWDKRKTKTSQDGETNWGTNYGTRLRLMAPGVAIATTDISGARGYSRSRTTDRFNGTSSATPFAAAAAALMLGVNPQLTGARVREILTATADRLTPGGEWSRHTGWGRLNAYAAVRAARRG